MSQWLLVATSFFAGILQTVVVAAQTNGCTDPAANNYNAAATINNGSCTYNQTYYTPPIKVDPISPALVESSGLQWAGNYLWSFNDGGHEAVLFRMDTTSGAVLQTLILEGATNVDWEDIAFDGTYFYIGDVGNNSGDRTDLKIYKLSLSAIPGHVDNPSVTIPASQVEVIRFSYGDQEQPPVSTKINQTKFDCEAMIVDGGKIHLFSKNWVDVTTTHYVIDGTAAGTYTAMPMETLATSYLVTAADKVPGTNTIILIGYQNSGTGLHFMHLFTNFKNGLYFNGNKRKIDLPNAAVMGQAEGIAFRTATYGYISNEKFERTIADFTLTVNQRLRSFNVNAMMPAQVLPVSLQQFKVTPVNGFQQIYWQFSEPVQQLQIQHSRNSINFTAIEAIHTSLNGRFQYPTPQGSSYYRISWQEANGTRKVSNIVQVTNKANGQVNNFRLTANGQLQFINGSSEAVGYQAKLIAVDGRTVAQTSKLTLVPGQNKIDFAKQLSHHAVLIFQMTGGGGEVQRTLQVE